MLKLFETARVLHIEPTDVCQAACPACARETDSTFNKELKHSYKLHDFKELVPERLIYRLDKVYMCGNYGDPAANTASKSILSYVREINSSITLGMNTNGGLQDTMWWADLANVMYKPEDYVVFSIDGLEDTNHIYRRNVAWKRIMHNARTFIEAGGNAHWDMLVFKHNEHQVDACEQLAKDMGFKWFRAKVSKREHFGGTERPVNWFRPVATGPIQCQALADNGLFLDAQGRFGPCCWLGEADPTADFEAVRASWNTDAPHKTCREICSSSNNTSNFASQWQKVVEF
jgi:MoaA/NifB/PqqE/SkfB family radical SAM enzyme